MGSLERLGAGGGGVVGREVGGGGAAFGFRLRRRDLLIDLLDQLDLRPLEEPVEVLDIALVEVHLGEGGCHLGVSQYSRRLALRDEELDLLEFLKLSY